MFLFKMKRNHSSVLHEELFRAVKQGSLRNIQSLVDQGADINATFDTIPHDSIMHVAAYYGHRDLLAFFLNKGLSVNAIDTNYRNTPLHRASAAGRAEAVQFLLDHNADMHAVNKLGQKPIHVAAEHGQKDVVQIYLKKGMDVQEADEEGSTLLYLSCIEGKVDLVQLLVNSKADIHAKDADGRKSIHVAAAWGKKDVVEYFLDLGMSVDETDQNGQTALHLAAKRDHLKVVQLLVDRIGANPLLDAQDMKGKTPMHLCRLKPDLLNCLLDAGARSDIKDHTGRTVLFYFMNDRLNFQNHKSIFAKMHHNFFDIDNRTKNSAAHLAITNDLRMDLIKFVLQHQKDLNIENKYGKTPMNYLTERVSLSHIDQPETLIRLFVNHGAYFKAVDCQRIVQNRSLKKRLFTDNKFCSHYLVNKFDNTDLPMLGKLPSAMSPLVLEKLKLKSGHICQIKRAVEEDIRNKGYCDVSKMAPPLLSMLAIESYILHYRSS